MSTCRQRATRGFSFTATAIQVLHIQPIKRGIRWHTLPPESQRKSSRRGGDEVTRATLTHFIAIHVAILPMLTILWLGLHLFLVQKHGMNVPLGVAREMEASHLFWPP